MANASRAQVSTLRWIRMLAQLFLYTWIIYEQISFIIIIIITITIYNNGSENN